MMPQPLVVQCPSCGSSEITYTCEPKCCFNHICAACYTTFELFTEPLGRRLTGVEKPSAGTRFPGADGGLRAVRKSRGVYGDTSKVVPRAHWSAPTAMPCYS